MGSRKKLVLACLLSLMMVLAFLVGLVPSYSMLNATAASGSNGRVDMVDLLNAVLNLKSAGVATEIAVTAPASGSIYMVPDNSLAAELPVAATATGDASDVIFAVDGNWADNDFDIYTDGVAGPPYASAINLLDLLSATTNVLNTHKVYAFANASVLLNAGQASLTYSLASSPVGFGVVTVDGSVDADGNGIIDNLAEISPGETWLAAYMVAGGEMRQVAIANLSPPLAKAGGSTMSVSPTALATVTAPTKEALGDAVNEDESLYLIVENGSSYEAMVDAVDDSSALADIQAWAADIAAAGPLGPNVPDSGILGINLLATSASTYREIDTLPVGNPITIALSGLNPPANRNYGVWSYPVRIQEGLQGFYFTDNPEDTKWEFKGVLVEDASLDAYVLSVTDLSMFVPFASTLELYKMRENKGQVGAVEATDVVGTFGYTTDLDLAQAQAAFAVYFMFDDISMEAEVTGLTVDVDEELLHINTPAVMQAVVAAVRVYDLAVASDFSVYAEVPGGFEFTNFYTLSKVSTPTEGGAIAANPDLDRYEQGSTVTLTAEPAYGYEFKNWAQDATGTDNPVTITMDGDKTVEAVFELAPRYTLTVTTEGQGSVTLAPTQPAEGYLRGELVTLTAEAEDGWEFVEWTGDVTGTDLSASVVMDGPKNVTAVFRNVSEPVLTLVVEPAGAGTILKDPDQVSYAVGTTVQLTAEAAACYRFDHWDNINIADSTANPTSIVMNQDETVTAVFVPLDTFELTVTVEPADIGANVALSETGPYCAGTVVTLEALAAADTRYKFAGWQGDVADPTNAITTIIMDADKSVTAFYSLTPPPIVGAVEPAEAWLFGGIRARITGSNFMPGATVTIGGVAATPLLVTDTEIYFIVPPLEDLGVGTEPNFVVDVIVTNPAGAPFSSSTLRNAFTYKRYETIGDVTTTAFYILDDGPFYIALGDDPTGAQLTLPSVEQTCAANYGIARVSKNPAAVLANFIDPIAADGIEMTGKIDDVWEFAVHLYDGTFPAGVVDNTQPLNTALYAEVKDCAYPRQNGVTPATLSFPVLDTPLTVANIRTGVSLWSINTSFDYGTGVSSIDVTTPSLDNTPALGTEYQSTLLAMEVDPNASLPEPAASEINSVVARIYDFSAFSLRNAVPDLPASIKAGVALDTAFGAGKGPFKGGTSARIVAPNGGFAWVRVAFGEFVTGKEPLNSSGLREATITNPGLNEFQIDLTSPAFPKPSPAADLTVDIGIYLASDLSKPVVVLKDAWQYKLSAQPEERNWWLLLLGLGAALLGLAAGGDSGGGGGGPCFIATAAYGTPMAADVDTLRAFRDAYLLNNAAGTAFVDTYYRVSPFIADLIARSPFLMGVVRIALMPVILIAKMPVFSVALVSLLAMFATVKRVVRRREH